MRMSHDVLAGLLSFLNDLTLIFYVTWRFIALSDKTL